MNVKLVDVNRSPVGERELPDGLPFKESIQELAISLDGRFVNPLDRSLGGYQVEVNGVPVYPSEAPKLTGNMGVTIIGLRHIG